MRGSPLEARDREPPARAARAEDDFACFKPQPAFGLDGVRVDEARGAGLFVNGYPNAFEVFAPDRMLVQVVDDLAHARDQLGILKDRLAHRDAVLTELSSLSEQPGCIGQCPHRNGSVIRRHSAKLAAGHKNRSGTQLCSPECSDQTGRTSADDDNIHEVAHFTYPKRPTI